MAILYSDFRNIDLKFVWINVKYIFIRDLRGTTLLIRFIQFVRPFAFADTNSIWSCPVIVLLITRPRCLCAFVSVMVMLLKTRLEYCSHEYDREMTMYFFLQELKLTLDCFSHALNLRKSRFKRSNDDWWSVLFTGCIISEKVQNLTQCCQLCHLYIQEIVIDLIWSPVVHQPWQDAIRNTFHLLPLFSTVYLGKIQLVIRDFHKFHTAWV